MDCLIWHTLHSDHRSWASVRVAPLEAFTELLGTKHIHTTAYHPMSNGLVERLHRQLKAAIKSYPHPEQWTSALPLALLGIRTEDIGCTAVYTCLGNSSLLRVMTWTPPATSLVCVQQHLTKLLIHAHTSAVTSAWHLMFLSAMTLSVSPSNHRTMVHTR